MKFFFHGASVTQQSKDDSYFFQLQSFINDEGHSFEIQKKGHGGCHFSDACVLTIGFDVPNNI
ncbi:hypothetical protein, partial [Rheinheimera baltica]|uniref:hypothetical protein n=1 Tax=Rheinheimera baltica TaxID=67576 RepID=UPI00273EA5AE